MNNEEKMERAIAITLRSLEENRKWAENHFRPDAAQNILKKVENYRTALKEFLDPDFVDAVFEKEGFPLGTDYRRGMIEEIVSWQDENWFTRQDLERMPTEWLERILGLKKEEE